MNILASYNWIKEFVILKQSPEEFARRVSLSGPGVERLYPQAPPFEFMIVGKVLELKPHPNADKLQIAVIDWGTDRAEIVCGGTNLSVGMKVVVALPGAQVHWHGAGDLITLEPTE
ncbi:phenylalanine--tRNA ligase subunit beta, partial [Patescibacteria group bacterium]|nr:phenylalanine--tRNA ligase subunit beta [Patescibacteria group bacterium]